MKTPLRLALIWLLLSLAAGTARVHADDYGYPLTDPYAATVIGTPSELQAPRLPERDIPHRHLDLTVFADRPLPDLLWYDRSLRIGLAYQRHQAPLIFIIAGTGGSYRSTRMRRLTNYFYQAGFHVVTLSSPTHPNFIGAASSTHYPGLPAEDARDLYRVMELAWRKIRDRIAVSEFYLAGYSLGGTQAAFVAQMDEQYRRFNFRKVLLINPAVNLYTSVTLLDTMLADHLPGGIDNVDDYFDRVYRALVDTYKQEDVVGFGESFLGEDALLATYQRVSLPGESLAALIGLSFREAVADMVFTADIINNAGYIKPKNLALSPTDSVTDYYKVAFRVSFIDYFRDLFLPSLQGRRPDLTEQALIQAVDLRSIEDYLKRATHIGVMTNRDDPILAPGELDDLDRIFGPRATIYPYGGHGGNLDYRPNVAAMIQFLKP